MESESSKPEYLPVAHLPVLGSIVSVTGSTEAFFRDAHTKQWKSFFSNFGHSLLSCGLPQRLKWLNTAILSIIACRWSSWPYSAALGKRLVKTQCHMVAMLLNYKRTEGISSDNYFRNRLILAG